MELALILVCALGPLVGFGFGVRFAGRHLPEHLATLEPDELRSLAQRTAEARKG